jgi:thiol-disulfide isomerase/thioredoxin
MSSVRTGWRFAIALFTCICAASSPVFAQLPGTPIEPRAASGLATPKLLAELAELKQAGKLMSGDQVREALASPTPHPVQLPAASHEELSPTQIAKRARDSQVRIGWYYLCPKCDDWHINAAGGYAIAGGGIVATCHHQILPDSVPMREGYLFALDSNDKPWPVTAILAAEKSMDTAVLVTGATDVKPLAFNESIEPGNAVWLHSDPKVAPGYFSAGIVNRFFWDAPGAGDLGSLDGVKHLRLNVTTDWAPGSSGSAVLDRSGNAVGHVSEISVQLAPERTGSSNATPDPSAAPSTRGTYLILRKAVPARVVRMLVQSMGDSTALATQGDTPVKSVAAAPTTAPAKVDAPEAALGIGKPAPALKVAKWIKGTPVEKFAEGQVYVVEFWATWCGPCKAAMPHLSELAKKYDGKATFVGVSVWEKFDTEAEKLAALEAFVQKQGDKMAYNVAADGEAGEMARTWLAAAGQKGIPCSMVIGKDGRIAWIGHPMQGLDEVVQKVIDGTFDVSGAADAAAARAAARRDANALIDAVAAARKIDDPDAIVAAIDQLVKAQPSTEVRMAEAKFDALLRIDEARAIDYLRELNREDRLIKPLLPVSTSVVSRITQRLLDRGDKLTPEQLDLVIDLRTRANEATGKKNPGTLSNLADALGRARRYDEAIAAKREAIRIMEGMFANGTDDTARQRYLERYKVELQALIESANGQSTGPATKPVAK